MTAAQAWDRYRSTVVAGGTPEQRRFAFDRWWRLERQEHARAIRAENRKKTKAAHA